MIPLLSYIYTSETFLTSDLFLFHSPLSVSNPLPASLGWIWVYLSYYYHLTLTKNNTLARLLPKLYWRHTYSCFTHPLLLIIRFLLLSWLNLSLSKLILSLNLDEELHPWSLTSETLLTLHLHLFHSPLAVSNSFLGFVCVESEFIQLIIISEPLRRVLLCSPPFVTLLTWHLTHLPLCC